MSTSLFERGFPPVCSLRKRKRCCVADSPGGISRTGHCVPSPRARIPPLLLALSNGATAGPIEIATGGSGIVDQSVPSPCTYDTRSDQDKRSEARPWQTITETRFSGSRPGEMSGRRGPGDRGGGGGGGFSGPVPGDPRSCQPQAHELAQLRRHRAIAGAAEPRRPSRGVRSGRGRARSRR